MKQKNETFLSSPPSNEQKGENYEYHTISKMWILFYL